MERGRRKINISNTFTQTKLKCIKMFDNNCTVSKLRKRQNDKSYVCGRVSIGTIRQEFINFSVRFRRSWGQLLFTLLGRLSGIAK